MTRQEEFGVPFIASEYSVLLLEKAFLRLEKNDFDDFFVDIELQKKHYGFNHACKVLNYIEKNRMYDFPENIRPAVRNFVKTVGHMISPTFEKYVREKYFSDMPYPRLF